MLFVETLISFTGSGLSHRRPPGVIVDPDLHLLILPLQIPQDPLRLLPLPLPIFLQVELLLPNLKLKIIPGEGPEADLGVNLLCQSDTADIKIRNRRVF